MTIAHSRAAALGAIISLFVLSGCQEKAHEYTLGSGERFCPPPEFDLTEGWRSSAEGHDGGFFASGCLNGRNCDSRLQDISTVLVMDWKPIAATGTSYYEKLWASGVREYSEDGDRFLIRLKPESRIIFRAKGGDADVSRPVAICDKKLCTRVVQAGPHEVTYSFTEENEFAGDVNSRDETVMHVLNSWRCRN